MLGFIFVFVTIQEAWMTVQEMDKRRCDYLLY